MTLANFVMAFLGGALGAAIGGGTAFITFGLLGLIGLAAAAAGDGSFMNLIMGSLLVPSVAYVSGVCAVQYARWRRVEIDRGDLSPLILLGRPDVLLVGGAFGILGFLVSTLLTNLGVGNVSDALAMTVFILCIVAKLLFARESWIGKVSDEVKKTGGRFSPSAPGLFPFCKTGFQKLVVGITVGGTSAFMTQIFLENPTLAPFAVLPGFFFFAAILFLNVPPLFHVALVASYAMLASGSDSIAWGIAGGVIAIFIGDFLARVLFLHTTGMIDTIAGAIWLGALIVRGLFPLIGLYALPEYIGVGIIGIIFVAISIFDQVKLKKYSQVESAVKDAV